MADLTIQEKLIKLEKLEQSNRDRSKRYLDKHKGDGKKQVSGLITEPAYNELCRRRDIAKKAGKTLTTGDILSEAIMNSIPVVPELKQKTVNIDGKGKDSKQFNLFDPDTVEVDPLPDTARDTKTDGNHIDLGDHHGVDLDTAAKDKILIQLADQLPGRENSQARVDALNDAGITCGKNGVAWDAKKFSDNLRFAKKRGRVKT